MKNIFYILIGLLLLGCGSAKLVKETEKSFQGNWTLTDVSYPDSSGFFDVTLFQTADAKCFETSEWKFVANNHRGTVDLYDTNCTTAQQNIVWSVEESDRNGYTYAIVLKMAEEGKARKETQGSRLQLKSITENAMVWDLPVSFDGKPMTVRLNFVKQ